LRISLDTKATVALGDYSRDGQSRGREAVKALDHDMQTKTKLVPVGILNRETAQLSITFGSSYKTTDLIVDCLEQGWERNKGDHRQVTELVINSDNGPESNSRRTQFMSRMVSFAQTPGLRIRLVYYPPYHSKYNPIERCWAALENHWNGTLLSTVETVIEWAKTMTWKGSTPVVTLSEKVYKKGVSLSRKAMLEVERVIQRSESLPKWDVVIEPQAAV
jgi:Rhodopirellula transposase DDE domain